MPELEKQQQPDLRVLQQFWNRVTAQMKKRVNKVVVWQAMEAAVVLDYEEGNPGVLVIGLPGEQYSLSGHLQVPDTRNLVESVMQQMTQRQMSFRLVECGSVQEWETYKVLEERKRAAALAMSTGKRPDPPAAPVAATPAQPAAPAAADSIISIDDILDRAYKMFAALPHRMMSQSRARFVRDATQMLAGAEGQLAATGMDPDALVRAIDRAIDKIAVWGECDSTTVALEYLRHKDRA